MPEGLSAAEVGKEIGEHSKHADTASEHIGESARSRYWKLCCYRWWPYSRPIRDMRPPNGALEHRLACKGIGSANKANRADLEGLQVRMLDWVSFNAWFSAFVAGSANAERLAERRLRAPGYRAAFYAWLATDPAHNPEAPPGPSYMRST